MAQFRSIENAVKVRLSGGLNGTGAAWSNRREKSSAIRTKKMFRLATAHRNNIGLVY
jgi:hypothetical protein